MLLIGDAKSKPLKSIFDSLNDVVLKMVDLIMLTAPYAVFALLANVVVSSGDPEILMALLKYAFVIVFGLILMIVIYCSIVMFFTKTNPFWFLKQISPAQLLAFSTSREPNLCSNLFCSFESCNLVTEYKVAKLINVKEKADQT